jgi:hypothetical protein
MDSSNPWHGLDNEGRSPWAPQSAGALFLGGMDWLALPESMRSNPPCPVVNIVQGLAHLKRDDPRFGFLKHPAIRICVNPVLAERLRQLPDVRGPVLHVPMGLDVEPFDEHAFEDRDCDVLIAGLKDPQMASALHAGLSMPGRKVRALISPVHRTEFLAEMRRARVAVVLPTPHEGFFLPALEAMASGCITVCVNVPAVSAYAVHTVNCLLSERRTDALQEAAEAALALQPANRRKMQDEAHLTVSRHSLSEEREAFLGILDRCESRWAEIIA